MSDYTVLWQSQLTVLGFAALQFLVVDDSVSHYVSR